MKKLHYTLGFVSILIAFLCLIEGCSKTAPASACIGAFPSTVSAGAPVSFTSCTAGATAYQWSFGDGATATGPSVTHTYAGAGTYTGTLTITSNGSNNSKNFNITVVNNTWTFKGNAFIADSVAGSSTGNDLTAYGVSNSNKANLVFVFPSLPTVSGSYNIININNAPPVGQQLYVVLYNLNSSGVQTSSYGSTGSGNVNAAVTVSEGKISIVLPNIEVANLVSAADSTSFGATIYQTQ
jgi:PKD repeat protein